MFLLNVIKSNEPPIRTARYRAATLFSIEEVCRSAGFETITVHDTTSFYNGMAVLGW